jgi:phosphoserine phosphatase
MTTVLLIRHGQTEWNRVERFRGRADVPLNETGIKQAEATGFASRKDGNQTHLFQSAIAGGQNRRAIAKHFDLPVQVHPNLADIDYGDWQGLSPDEVRARWADALDNWYNAPHLANIPNGETLADLRERAMKTVHELAARHADETIVLLGHTVINRIILLGVLGLSNDHFWRINQDTCAINVFEMGKGDYTLVSLNDTCHLDNIPER